MKHYKLYSGIAAVLVALIGVLSREAFLSILASVCSTVYMITLSAEKRCAFLFGMAYCITFSYISLVNGLYATAAFFFGYLLPVLTVAFFRNANSPERHKPPMRGKQWALTVALVAAVFALLFILLRCTNDAQPCLDALSFSVSAVTSLLMLLHHKEFWILNTLACCLSITMWTIQFAVTRSGVNIILLHTIALVSSVFGMANWIRHMRAGASPTAGRK